MSVPVQRVRSPSGAPKSLGSPHTTNAPTFGNRLKKSTTLSEWSSGVSFWFALVRSPSAHSVSRPSMATRVSANTSVVLRVHIGTSIAILRSGKCPLGRTAPQSTGPCPLGCPSD